MSTFPPCRDWGKSSYYPSDAWKVLQAEAGAHCVSGTFLPSVPCFSEDLLHSAGKALDLRPLSGNLSHSFREPEATRRAAEMIAGVY